MSRFFEFAGKLIHVRAMMRSEFFPRFILSNEICAEELPEYVENYVNSILDQAMLHNQDLNELFNLFTYLREEAFTWWCNTDDEIVLDGDNFTKEFTDCYVEFQRTIVGYQNELRDAVYKARIRQ